METWLFLLLILAVSFFGKNNSLIVATLVVMAIKLIPALSEKWFPVIQTKGIKWGVTIISLAIMIPNSNVQNTLK